jgi:hypothetical protein
MKSIALWLIVLVTMAVSLCKAQVTPVVAKERIVHDVLDSQGNVVSHSETFGKYLRNSAGSTITQIYSSVGGKTAIRSGQLEDYSRQKLYALNYERQEAVEQGNVTHGPHPEYLANAKTALGEETVNGLPCLIHSVFMDADGKQRLIGKKYDSAEYGLTVKEDAIFQLPGTPPTRRIVELYDIQIVEPDPKEFALEKFSFLEKGPAACSKPDTSASLESLK